MPSENTIYFYPGRGGHSHDGNNSSFIDTSVYSLFDFSWGEVGDPDRVASQRINYNAFRDFVITTVNGSILEPAGLVLQPGMVNGTAHIISRSIEANTIAANTLTANEISANTITSNELAANFVLVNTIIASSDFNGTFNPTTFALSNTGTDGWAITSAGDAVFTNGFFRGSLEIGANDYWYSNGAFALGGNTGIFRNIGGGITLGANVTIQGGVVATSVATPGIDIDANGNLTSNASTFGIYANGAIFTSSGNFQVDAGGNLYAENATIYGEINATSGSVSGDLVSGGTISGVTITGSLITAGSSYFDQYGTLDINGSYDTGGGWSGAYRFLIDNSAGYPFTMLTSSQGSAQLAGNEFRLTGPFGAGGIYMNNHFTIDPNGGMYPDTGAYNSAFFIKQEASGEALSRVTSKREHKKDITSFIDLSLIDELNPVKYKWINGSPNEKEILKQKREQYFDIGFIAEEVAEIRNGELAEYEIINDMAVPAFYKVFDIVALSVANIKDLRTRISSLEARIAELEG
jgi:hypothetical protein